MIATTESEYIGDFLAFLAACWPGRADALRRRGASMDDIAKLAAVSGFALPPFYVAFLEEFGADTGLSGVRGDGQATVTALLEHYADPIEMLHTPPGGVVVATAGLMHARMILEDGSIGCFLGQSRIEYVMASSYRNLAYQCAFAGSRGGESVWSYHRDPAALADAASLLVDRGFTPYWFSDAHGFFAESDDAWVHGHAEEKSTSLWIGSRDPAAREAPSAALRANLGFARTT